MSERPLHGRRILVVEDEYLIADDMCAALADAGAEIVGPAPTCAAAAALIDTAPAIDAALLDINLRGEQVFAIADALAARSVPFAFATGYDRTVMPARFRDAPQLEKPVKARQVIAMLAPLLIAPAG